MVRISEAIFKDGVLKPTEKLDLREDERVRITVESLAESGDAQPPIDRAEAIRRFHEGQASMRFKSEGPYPTRDELHERLG